MASAVSECKNCAKLPYPILRDMHTTNITGVYVTEESVH